MDTVKNVVKCLIYSISIFVVIIWSDKVLGSDDSTVKSPPSHLQVLLDLIDGSRMIGILQFNNISVKTEFAQLQLNIKLLEKIQFDRGEGNKGGAKTSFVNRVKNDASLRFGDRSFTICAWAKTSARGRRGIVGTNWEADYGVHISITRDGNAQFVISTRNKRTDVIPEDTITDGSWHHLVGVRDSGNNNEVMLYLDGIKGNTFAKFSRPIVSSVDWGIEVHIRSDNTPARIYNNFFQGYIDEVMIFNCADGRI